VIPFSSESFHPDGWSRDFYLIEGDVCRMGVRALPKLGKLVGRKNFTALLGDYGSGKAKTPRFTVDAESNRGRKRFVPLDSSVELCWNRSSENGIRDRGTAAEWQRS